MTTRRAFTIAVSGTIATGLLTSVAHSADGPKVQESDPQAQALGYRTDTNKVPDAKYPAHKRTQDCGNCQLYQGKAGEAEGPCPLFSGKHVMAKGWCSAWAKKA